MQKTKPAGLPGHKQTSLRINKLPKGTTEEELQQHFQPYGPVDSINFGRAKGRKLNYAYINYATHGLGKKIFFLDLKPKRIFSETHPIGGICSFQCFRSIA